MNRVWVVLGDSESGDKYMAVLGKEPTGHVKKKLAFCWDGDEDNPTGVGYKGSNIHLDVIEKVIDGDLE